MAESLFVPTAVGRLFVEITGAGPAVIGWPSLFCDGRTLALQARELSRDHRVIVVDGPGHGRSGPPLARFTLEDSARSALQVLDAVGASRAIFLGSAWGGHVGVSTALLAPARLRGLVLVNSPMNSWKGSIRLQARLLYELFRRLGARPFLVNIILGTQLSPAVRAAHPEHAEVIADCVRSSEKSALALAMLSAMLDRPSLEPRLGEVAVPTLVITGDADSIYPVSLARAHASAIRGARFEVIGGSAHQSGLEYPDQVNALIRGFVDGLPG
jgi:pimeloyl-ACP methyl ester carboxylesterase